MHLLVENLQHTYQARGLADRAVLSIDSWQLEAGSQVLLRGISGSGKTTLLNILSGLLAPSSGTVTIGEQSLFALREAERDRFRAQNIGYVFQSHLLAPHLTALQNVEMPLVFGNRMKSKEARKRAAKALKDVGLGEHLRNRPAQLSVGQRLRVSVARALVATPQLLLADEPTASLDEASSTLVMDLIQEHCHAQGSMLIVASHDPALPTRFEQTIDLKTGSLFNQN